MNFNINNYVTVVLSKAGAEVANAHEEYLRGILKKTTPAKVYSEGDTYKTQFWHLITIFKDQIGLGMASPFVNCNLELEVKNNEG